MINLFDIVLLKTINGTTLLDFKCEHCFSIFKQEAKYVKSIIKRQINGCRFCNKQCANQFRFKNRKVNLTCTQCAKHIFVRVPEILKSKSGNNFCSRSCAAIYNHAHKKTGTRRSKLEIWLEQALTAHYPNLEFIFNGKETINSELDIYVPELKLAFELNGIFHYEAIFGPDKLASIQNNDGRKFQACLERGIELVIIDTSREKAFKAKHGEKYLDIIISIISRKL